MTWWSTSWQQFPLPSSMRKVVRNKTLEECTKRCGIIQVGLAGSGEKEDQTTPPEHELWQGQGSRGPPLHRMRDGSHLPPNQEDRVSAHAKPHTTTKSILVAFKDKDHPQDKCGVVYQLTCHDCEASYIGETERALKQRLKERQKDSSPVGHHMGYNKHHVDHQDCRPR